MLTILQVTIPRNLWSNIILYTYVGTSVLVVCTMGG